MGWAMPSRVAASLMSLIAIAGTGGPADAGTLDKLRQDKLLRIAYREDAPPFSFVDKTGLPTGFMIDLCLSVARKVGAQLNLGDLKIAYVPVTAATRFDAIAKGEADLLCEPTTETLSRRTQVDFSLPTFIDGASVLVSGEKPADLRALAGKKVGVLAGTTTEQTVHNALTAAGVSVEIVPTKTHDEGLAMLDAGQIEAYFAERSILAALATRSKAPEKLHLADNYLTLEPYALALPHGDDEFRLAVDRALSHIYRSGEITSIMQHSFGGNTKPSQPLQLLYVISALPD